MSEKTGDQAAETVVTVIYPPGCREVYKSFTLLWSINQLSIH